MRFGIVGGGVSGLTAAYEAVKRGHEAEIFEGAAEIGGLASSFVFHGVPVDRYYHFICGSDHDIVDLAAELGEGAKLHWRATRMSLFMDGALHPFGGALDLLRFRPIPLRSRLRFGLHAAYCRFVRDWRRFDHRTGAEWLRATIGDEGYRAIWEPLLRSKFGAHADHISAPWIWHRVHRLGSSRRHLWSKEQLGYLEGGSKPIVDGLLARLEAARVPIHTGARVDAVAIEDGRASGLVIGGEKRAFDRVVAAVPLPAFARLLPSGQEELRQSVAHIRFIGVVCVVLLLRRRLTDAFWVNVNDPQVPMSGFIEYTNLDPLPGLGGRALVYVPYYVPADHPIYLGRDQALVDETVAGLERVVPGFGRAEVEDWRIFRDRHAQAICPAGFAAMVPPVATSVPGLFLVDSTQLYPADRSRSGMIGIVRRHAGEIFGDRA